MQFRTTVYVSAGLNQFANRNQYPQIEINITYRTISHTERLNAVLQNPFLANNTCIYWVDERQRSKIFPNGYNLMMTLGIQNKRSDSKSQGITITDEVIVHF